ncbi:hypothetical protein, variant [Aphanomyces invadans]|uniref:Uncharacterized protein n=1 Tax=Aphanomyces invadans TaxID=157072 RepID=A0A024U7F6_9STRA|nr:hypothetical protein, variant [Aphanomyces invadans]ETW02346.1 hypothetical protein, variant [Aphanomyces invadans]|eukprot:XP_008868951.1 hypothetical protein, variant [Aphanomyces invadans]
MILDPSHATPGTVQALPTHVPGVFSANALRDLFQKSPTKQKKIARTVESKPQHAAGHRRPTAHKQASDHNDSMQLRIWLQQRVPSSSIVHNELRSHAIRAALAVDSASAAVDEHVRWIKNNVPLHSVPKGVISNRTKISSFVDVLRRILHARLLAAFSLWHDAVVSDKQAAAVAQFVRSEAVQSLQDIWERSWQRKRDRAFYMWHVEVRCGQTQELHAAAAEIQRWVKMFQRRHLLYAMRRTRAATQLQSNYRRHTTRKAFRRLVQAEAVRRAATTVQAAYRRKRSRRTFLNALLVYVQSQAAVVLQRWMRNTIYRMQWLRRRWRDVLATEAATCIQRTVRAFLTRGWCRRIRQDKRAATIQRAWRRSRLHSRGPLYASIAHLAQSIQLGMHAWHATVLQAAARGFIGRRCVTKRRLERRSAISLQRTWREYVARQRRTQTRQERRLRRLLAAHCIQATYRGYRDRVLFRLAMTKSCVPMYLRACRLQSMPLQLVFRERFHNSIVHSASSVIATVWRRYWRRKVSRHKELTAAAVVVQTIYRSQRTQRWFRKHVARIRRSATSIQRMVRSRLARNHTKQHIAAMKKVAQAAQTARSNQAALRVQAAWRKKKGRMALHLRRQAQELEMARRHASSKTIQVVLSFQWPQLESIVS